MILALFTLAAAHDIAPAVFVPSTAPGDFEGEVQAGMAYRSVLGSESGGTYLTTTVRLERVALGASAGFGPQYPYVGTAWVGLAVVDTQQVRLQVFGEVGGFLRPGFSFVARTPRGGIGGHGVSFDVAWGPAWSVDRLLNPSWSGPFDLPMSMPEGGISVPLDPSGSQFLRVGFMGPSPMVSYRLDLRRGRRGGFVLESSLGAMVGTGVATISFGWSGAHADRPHPVR